MTDGKPGDDAAKSTAKAGAMSVWQAQLMNPTQLLTVGATLYYTVRLAMGMLSRRLNKTESVDEPTMRLNKTESIDESTMETEAEGGQQSCLVTTN